MAYMALYRKYRPNKFEDVIGQKITVKILKNSIIENKIGHAYIFSGPRGTGKTSVAKIFAKAVNCINSVDGDVCGSCAVCDVSENNDIDLIEIDAASNNGIDEIREIRNNTKLTPSVGKYKIYIIDEVHMLSTGAFNAMLKTLEEPPAHVIFILATTEIQKIPLTILSRCQKFDFHKIPDAEMNDRIKYILKQENRELNEDVIKTISKMSEGCCRDAINLLDQVLSLKNENITTDDIYEVTGDIKSTTIFELLDTILENNYSRGLEIINENYNNGKNLNIIINKMLIELRNISININLPTYFDEDEIKKYEKYSELKIYDISQLGELLTSLSAELKKTSMQKILFEIFFMKMCDLFKNSMNKNLLICDEKEQINPEIEDVFLDKKINEKDIQQEENYFPGNKKSIRINNALSEADKAILKSNLIKYQNITEYSANKTFNNAVSILMEGKPVVCSNKYCVIQFKYESSISLFEKNIKEIEELIKKVFGKKYKVAALTEEEWIIIREEYIKNRDKYKFIEETDEEKSNELTKNIIETNAAFELFGEDVVTIK